METLTEEHRNDLIKILNTLDHCRSNKKTRENTELMQTTIQEAFEWITLHNKIKENELILQILEYLTILKKDQNINESFGDYKLNYLVDINTAYFIQIDPYLGKNNAEYLANAIRTLIIEYRKNQESYQIENIEKSSKVFSDIKFEYTMVKNYLQLGASNSQLDRNEKAVKCGKKSLYYFSKMLTNLHFVFNKANSVSENILQTQDKIKLGKNEELKKDFNDFFNSTIKINNLILTSLKKLDRKEFNLHEFFVQIHEIEKSLQKRVFKSNWMKNISIGNFMHVEFFTLKKISHEITFNEIFTEGFLSLIIMLVSTVYFMLSTENRIICFRENEINGKSQFKIKPIFEKTHLEKLKKTKKFVFAEKLHGFALKLLKNYFEPNQLLNHISDSYCETYDKKLDLEKILEEDSFINQSYNKSTYRSSIIEYSLDHSSFNPSITNRFSNIKDDPLFQDKSYFLKNKLLVINDIRTDSLNSKNLEPSRNEQIIVEENNTNYQQVFADIENKSKVLKLDYVNKKTLDDLDIKKKNNVDFLEINIEKLKNNIAKDGKTRHHKKNDTSISSDMKNNGNKLLTKTEIKEVSKSIKNLTSLKKIKISEKRLNFKKKLLSTKKGYSTKNLNIEKTLPISKTNYLLKFNPKSINMENYFSSKKPNIEKSKSSNSYQRFKKEKSESISKKIVSDLKLKSKKTNTNPQTSEQKIIFVNNFHSSSKTIKKLTFNVENTPKRNLVEKDTKRLKKKNKNKDMLTDQKSAKKISTFSDLNILKNKSHLITPKMMTLNSFKNDF
jgi:hypothetical protein